MPDDWIWVPSSREHYYNDFEDRLDLETDSKSEEVAWVVNIPEEFEDGTDLSPDYFLFSAMRAEENNDARFADFNYRKAAQRGSWLAMQYLAEDRYHLGFLEESIRWNRRLVTCLQKKSPEEHYPQFKDVEETLEETLTVTKDNIDFLTQQLLLVASRGGKNAVTDLIAGQDLDFPDDAEKHSHLGQWVTYCLKCGKMKIADTPLAQCDDLVHVVI